MLPAACLAASPLFSHPLYLSCSPSFARARFAMGTHAQSMHTHPKLRAAKLVHRVILHLATFITLRIYYRLLVHETGRPFLRTFSSSSLLLSSSSSAPSVTSSCSAGERRHSRDDGERDIYLSRTHRPLPNSLLSFAFTLARARSSRSRAALSLTLNGTTPRHTLH